MVFVEGGIKTVHKQTTAISSHDSQGSTSSISGNNKFKCIFQFDAKFLKWQKWNEKMKMVCIITAPSSHQWNNVAHFKSLYDNAYSSDGKWLKFFFTHQFPLWTFPCHGIFALAFSRSLTLSHIVCIPLLSFAPFIKIRRTRKKTFTYTIYSHAICLGSLKRNSHGINSTIIFRWLILEYW